MLFNINRITKCGFYTCILIWLLTFVLPFATNAQQTTLITSVPFSHTFHLNIDGKGTVSVNGNKHSKTKNISVNRHSEPFVQIQAARGYSVRSVVYNNENITHLFNSGKWTMPKVESDITLSVVFVRDNGNPPTGDTFNPWLLVLCILSLLGLLACALMVRKHKRI